MTELLFIILLSATSVTNPSMVTNFPPVEVRISQPYATVEDCVTAKLGTATVIDANRVEADTATYIVTIVGVFSCRAISSSGRYPNTHPASFIPSRTTLNSSA